MITLIEARKKRKKKVADSIMYTTGDISYNMDMFNKHFGSDVNPGSVEAPEPCPDSGNCAFGAGEALTEAKRYVRRYYIRPQNIFCSNKNDILMALIEFEDQDCTIYTLNNLGDEKDVTKLTNKDIIYYYEDGMLFDKNMVKLMDYDLYIKHEEERKQIDPEHVSDAVFNDVYKDRITGNMEEAFSLDFDSINAYGEKLVEGNVKDDICCICGEKIDGYGNNPEPYISAENGHCCDACNTKFVIPARLEQSLSREGAADENK